MKRNDDLIREILINAEADSSDIFFERSTLSKNAGDKLRLGHIRLLCDVGYVEDHGKGSYRITSQGHDYLDAIRDESIWSETKSAIAKAGGNATLEIFKSIAVGFLKKKIEFHTDVKL